MSSQSQFLILNKKINHQESLEIFCCQINYQFKYSRDMAMMLVKSEQWESSLRNVRSDDKGRRLTPFRMMIRKFPDVAEAVLDR